MSVNLGGVLSRLPEAESPPEEPPEPAAAAIAPIAKAPPNHGRIPAAIFALSTVPSVSG